MRKILCCVAAAMAMSGSAAAAANFCGELANSFGPYDYRKRQTEYVNELFLVHSAHFTKEIEDGIRGRSGTLAGELDYTLRAFPNHIRALVSLDRLSMRDKLAVTLPGSRFPVECWYERAIRFAPDDGEAHAAYGNYLFARGKNELALKMFERAVQLSPEDATINYNLGLLYMKGKDYDKASVYGRNAYKLGFPLPGLKNQLMAVGKWEAPAEEPAPATPVQ